MKPYTSLSPAWLDSLALALLHYRRQGDLRAEDALVEKLHNAVQHAQVNWEAPGESLLALGVADVCLAVARRLEGAVPQGSAGLEFRDMETGETVDPEMFTTTCDGQASVWAARICAAALNGDRAMVETLVDTQLGTGAMPLMLGFRALILGASMVDEEGARRDQAVALEAMSHTGNPPSYIMTCYAEGPFTPQEQRGEPCLTFWMGDRLRRDAIAAHHVLETGHAVLVRDE